MSIDSSTDVFVHSSRKYQYVYNIRNVGLGYFWDILPPLACITTELSFFARYEVES
jgi:hypothetical protein